MKKFFNKIINSNVLIYLIPLFIVDLMNIFYNGYNFSWYCTLGTFKTQLLSYLIVYALYAFFLGCTKSSFKSTIILSTLALLLVCVNQIKISYTGEPIIVSDLLFLQDGSELLDIADKTIFVKLRKLIIPVIMYLALVIFICYRVKKKKFIIENKKHRLLMIFLPIIFLSVLVIPSNITKNFMLNYIFDKDKIKDYSTITSNKDYFKKYGFLPGIYGQYLENIMLQPSDYDEELINKVLLEAQIPQEDKIFGKPNIITIFAESFWDVDQLTEVEFDTAVTPNFNKLKDEGIFFNMISPSYGGVSANVEFEYLTGASLMFFNRGFVPYMGLYNNDTYYNRPSIISELSKNGYRTKLTTYTTNKLFSCGKVYNYFGIDDQEFLSKVSKKHYKGKYVSDEYVVDHIIEEFETKPKDEKLFYMSLTMQAHMPYFKDKYKTYDVNIKKSNLNKDMNEALVSYSQGIYDTDKQLGRLYEYIKTLEEPTIIVFFGDHLPYLESEEGEDVFKNLKYFNTNSELKNAYRKYNTQALILANFPIQDEETKFLGVDLLGAYILNKMDIDVSDYYRWLYTTKDSLSASNYLVSTDSNGKLYFTNDLKGDLKKTYNLRNNIQYKYFIK